MARSIVNEVSDSVLSEIHAVLWDMDGTIVDTEPYWFAAEYEVVAKHGDSWSDDHARAVVGFDLLDSGRYMIEHGGVRLTPHEIVEMLLDSVVANLKREVPWRPGARELLAEVRDHGIPTALVTMSWKRFAMEVVNALPAGAFDTSVVGDDVERGKPHPDPYLLAAERLGVDITKCIAIEDSPTGVASALAAGATVLAVPHHVDVPMRDDVNGRMIRRETLEGLRVHDLMSFLAKEN
jgi:HAD superfamily hydrolase (TIGR01509 family)